MSEQNIFIRAGHDASREECEDLLGARINDLVWDQHIDHKSFLCKSKGIDRVTYLPLSAWEWLGPNNYIEVFPNLEILM